MANIGRKILSAFVEIPGDENETVIRTETVATSSAAYGTRTESTAGNAEKFRQYFDQLFKDANLPGPDYFEFSKMTEAMQSIPDERARYSAAFAGLSVQGLDKQKLLNTVAQYIQVLETDAANFNSTVDAALKEKVQSKQQEVEHNSRRIEAMNKEISELQNRILQLNQEVKENEEKIENNSGAYSREMQQLKNKMLGDAEKIKQYIA